MCTHAQRLANGLASPFMGQSLFIHRMTSFVNNRHHRTDKARCIVPGGNPHIIRNAATKRMMTDVKTAVFKIETKRRHQRSAKRFLLHITKVAGNWQHFIFGLQVHNLVGELRKKALEVGKNGVDLFKIRANRVDTSNFFSKFIDPKSGENRPINSTQSTRRTPGDD